jgi:ABC-type glycerol-3-phosphate transport system substrate-binding protein
MKSIVMRSFLVAAAASAAMACGGTSNEPPPPVTLELDTWWTKANDLKGIQEIAAMHTMAHPNVTVQITSLKDSGTLDASVTTRFASGTPPAALQANLGANATQFAANALGLVPTWKSNFSSTILDQLTLNGKLIGVPLGLTRQNVAYYNLRILRTLPAPYNQVPVGLEDNATANTIGFKTWVAGVSAAGFTHPLCFGFKDGWVNAHILFEDVVPAVAGPDASRAYWTGKDDAAGTNAAKISAALDFAATYVIPYLGPNCFMQAMGVGVNQLMVAATDPSTQCIMTAMGDWGGNQLASAPDSFVPGDANNMGADFTSTGWPGAENLLDFGGDAMVAAVGTGNERDVAALFDTMASEPAQFTFAKDKGEIPASTLTPAHQALLPYLIQNDLKTFGPGGTQLPGYKLLAKKAYDTTTVGLQSQQFMQTGDKTALVAWMATAYSTLQ